VTYAILLCESKQIGHPMFHHNFGKRKPIYKILSPHEEVFQILLYFG